MTPQECSLAIGPNMILPDGRTLIKAFENCRLEAYPDSKGKWTIGWGHTGPEVQVGLRWTQEQCDSVFESDFSSRLHGLDQLGLSLSPGQMAAVQSLVYNIGLGAFQTSHLLACIRSSDWIGATHEFIRWDHVGASEAEGLLHRRLAEGLVFITGSR